MPRLLPDFPPPATAADFTSGADGWQVVDWPGAGNPRPPVWSDGGIAYTPKSGEAAWRFLAPAEFVSACRSAAGGTVALGFPIGTTAGTLVLAGAGTSLTADLSSLAQVQGERLVAVVALTAAAWRSEDGQSPSERTFAEILGGLTNVLVQAPCLTAAEIYDDPHALIRPAVHLAYTAGRLTARWSISPLAAAYRVVARDGGGNSRLDTTIAVSDLIQPMPITWDGFSAAAAADITVEVTVLGEPGADTGTVVDLGVPSVSAMVRGSEVTFTWPPVPEARTYAATVTVTGGAELSRPDLGSPTLTLGKADGVKGGDELTAVVRAIRSVSTGPWSDPCRVTIPAAQAILEQLRQRLLEHRPAAGSLAFDATTLPADGAGRAGRVLDLLNTALATAGGITIATAADPALSPGLLTVTGTADVAGITHAAVLADFTVSDDLTLELDLRLIPADGWVLPDSFPGLSGSGLLRQTLTAQRLWFATRAHARADEAVALAAGLTYAASLRMKRNLTPLLPGAIPADAVDVPFGGLISPAEPVTEFTLAGTTPLPDLSILPIGHAAMILAGGRVDLQRRRGPEGTAVESFRIAGTTMLAGATVSAWVDLPDPSRFMLRFSVQPSALVSSGLGTALADLSGGDSAAARLPASLAALAGLSVDEFTWVYDPFGIKPTTALMKVNSQAGWVVVPDLVSLNPLTVTLQVQSYSEDSGGGFQIGGSVDGRLALGSGGASLALSASIGPGRVWTFRLSDDSHEPTLDTIAALVGAEGWPGFVAGLPEVLRSLLSVSLTELALTGNPYVPSLDGVAFRVAQLHDWTVVSGILAFKDWGVRAAFERQKTGWKTRAVVEGTARFGTTDVAMRLPLGDANTPWCFELAPGATITIPTIGEVVGMLGGDAAPLPDGISSLGGLDITRLAFVVTPSGPTLNQVAFAFAKTETPWTIVSGLQVTGLSAAFALTRGAQGMTAVGKASGEIRICNTAVDIHLSKPMPESDWRIWAGDTNVIHVPGLADLAAWMSPSGVEAWRPSWLPMAKGFDLSAIELVFSSSGKLKKAGFQMLAKDVWPLLPGKLEVTMLTAQLTTTFPASAASVTGRLEAMVAICRVPIRLTADKPAVTDSWRLSGSLVGTVGIDLVDAANQVAPTAVSLPGGVASFGLPSKITILGASAQVVPDTGYFRFAGAANFTDWNFSLLGIAISIRTLGGEVKIPGSGKPAAASLYGRLGLNGLTADVFLKLGGADADVVLLGTLTADQVQDLSFNDLTGSFASGDTLSQLPLPQGFTVPAMADAAVYLNATRTAIAVYGRAGTYASGALLLQKVTVKDAASGQTSAKWGFALALKASDPFTFAGLVGDSAPTIKTALGLIDQVLHVDQASLTLSSFTAGPDDPDPYAILSLVSGSAVAPVSPRLGRGLNVSGNIKLDTWLWQNLAFIIEDRSAKGIAIQATIVPDDPSATVFRASLGNFVILRTVTLTTAELDYCAKVPALPAQPDSGQSRLRIACTGSVSIPGMADTGADSQLFSFSGTLAVTDARADALLDITTGSVLRRPLGIPQVTLESLTLALGWQFARTQAGQPQRSSSLFEMRGVVSGRIGLQASVLFVDFSPKVVRIALTESLSLSDLFDWFIHSEAWKLLPDLTFSDGAITYATTDLPALDVRQGLRLGAHIDIWDHRFSVALAISDSVGIEGAGRADFPLDLGFIAITGPNGTFGPGVALSTLNGNRRFDLEFGFDFIGLAFRDGRLSYVKPATGNEYYEGSITYDGTNTVLGAKFTLTARWSKQDGFRITQWPCLPTIPGVDVVKLIESVGKGDACGALGAMGIGPDIIQGQFKVDLNVANGTPTTGADGKSVATAAFTIKLRYEVSVKLPGGSDPLVLNPNAKPLESTFSIAVTNLGSIEGLMAKISEFALASVEGLVHAVVNDPEAMAQLVGAIAVKELSTQALSSLICRNVKSDSLKNEYSERSKSDTGESESGEETNTGEQALESAEAAAADAVAAGGAAAAAAAAGSAGTYAAVAIGFFASLLAVLASLFGIESQEQKAARRRKERAEQARDRAKQAVRDKLTVGAVSIAYLGNGRVRVDWQRPAGDEGVRYYAQVSCNGSEAETTSGTQASSLEMSVAQAGPGRTVQATVFGLYDDYSGNPVIASLRIPDYGPASLTLAQVGNSVTASWQAGSDTPPQGWSVTALCPGQPNQTATLPAATHEWSFTPTTGSSAWTVAVSALGAGYPVDAVTASLTLSSLAAPTGLAGFYDQPAGTLTVSWQAAAAPGGCRVALQDASGTVFATRDIPAGQPLNTSFTVPDELAGETVALRVAVLSAGGVQAVWARPFEIALIAPAAPEVTSLVHEAPDVIGAWAKVAGASRYEVRLTDAGGKPLAPAPSVVQGTGIDGTPNAVFTGTFTAGQVAGLSVRAVSTTGAGRWSAIGADGSPSRLTIQIVPPPAAPALVNRDATIDASWAALPQATDGYRVQVATQSGPLSPQPKAPIIGTTAAIDAAGLVDGSSYLVRLRAAVPRNTSLPGPAASIVRLPETPGRFVTLHNTLADTPLTVTVTAPGGMPAATLAAASTGPVGTGRVRTFQVVQAVVRSPELSELHRCRLDLTTTGKPVAMEWNELSAGTAPDGFALVRDLGFRLTAGGQELWPDAMSPADMAAALHPVLHPGSALATALATAYPAIGLSGVALALTGVLGGLDEILPALAGMTPPPTPAALLSALSTAFGSLGEKLDPLTAAAFYAAILSPSPAVLAEAVTDAVFVPAQTGNRTTLAALCLRAAKVKQADATAALAGRTDLDAAVGAAYGDATAFCRAAAPVMATAGIDPLTAAWRLFAVGGKPSLADIARIMGAAWPQATPFVLLRLLAQVPAGPDLIQSPVLQPDELRVISTVAEVSASAIAARPQISAIELARALKALYPGPDAAGQALAVQGDDGTAAAALQAQFPDLSPVQLGWLLLVRNSGRLAAIRMVAGLKAAGVKHDAASAALHDLYPWLSAEAVDQACGPTSEWGG